jgi:hypothetical protein
MASDEERKGLSSMNAESEVCIFLSFFRFIRQEVSVTLDGDEMKNIEVRLSKVREEIAKKEAEKAER